LNLALTLTLSLTFCALGCGRFTRTRQCRALIAQVNPALDEVLTLTDAGVSQGGASGGGGMSGAGGSGGTGAASAAGQSANGGGARYIAAAGRYERLAKELGPMEFSSEQMAKSVAEYASVLTSTAETLRTLATAIDANNAAEADRANHELERLILRERSVVARMDAWCQPQ
jgi:hypothetical protein